MILGRTSVGCLLLLANADGFVPHAMAPNLLFSALATRRQVGTAPADTQRPLARRDDDDDEEEEEDDNWIPPNDFTIEEEVQDIRRNTPDFTIEDDDDVFPPAQSTFRGPKPSTLDDQDRWDRRSSSHSRRSSTREYDSDKSDTRSSPRRRTVIRQGRSAAGASWVDRNAAFVDAPEENSDNAKSRTAKTFRQDFRGTRVFVQGLPPDASWQDVKDHFRIAGEVVFASVSGDPVTGESKCCGIVQYETTEMALTAIAIMRNHPLNGFQLFVREDVQEASGNKQLQNLMPRKKGPTPPSKWKCANEENASYLSEDERKAIVALIKARDDARRRKKYDASDAMREELKFKYGVHIDDRLYMWWTTFDGNQVPQTIKDIKGEGRWGSLKPWRQIPTTPENDACVDPDLVNALLTQRDVARREKDFSTADALLEEARASPDGDLYLRIHDESRTWRIWTDASPPRPVRHELSAAEQCLAIVREYAPDRANEIKMLLDKFKGREYNILKKLKSRYLE